MAKIVVLVIENDGEANRVVQALRQQLEPVMVDPTTVELAAVYKYPVVFCECPPPVAALQGKKYGWFICDKCHKAVEGYHPAKDILEPRNMRWVKGNLAVTFNARRSHVSQKQN